MKKLLLVALMLTAITTFSQGNLNKGDLQLNGGIGFSGWGMPVYGGIDYGVGKNFTVGGDLSYRGYSDKGGYYKYSYKVIGIGVNGNYHFNEVLEIPNEWDVYGGATLGYYIWKNSAKYNGPGEDIYYGNNYNYAGSSGLGLGLQIGGRYFFTNKFGVNLEVGGGSVFGGKLGITYKLGGSGKSSRKTSSTSSKKTSSSNVADSPKETTKKAETKAIVTEKNTSTTTKTSTTSAKKTVSSSTAKKAPAKTTTTKKTSTSKKTTTKKK